MRPKRLTTTRPQLLLEQLRDERSRRVVFVAHCILNENTRYLGGAFRPGVVEEVLETYVRSGFEVVGIVGIGGSPSCGVERTLDLKHSLPVLASTPIDEAHRETFNETAIAQCVAEGQGLFIRALERELDRRGLNVPFLEHDLIAEMDAARH